MMRPFVSAAAEKARSRHLHEPVLRNDTTWYSATRPGSRASWSVRGGC